MTQRVALITGITGQDGSFLAEFLLSKSYIVHGTRRRASTDNLGRIAHIADRLTLWYADMTDPESLHRVICEVQPDEVYNLAAQSFVSVSFQMPDYTRRTIYDGTMYLLESCRQCPKQPRIYQACSSEQFGNSPAPQSESTPFAPVSPYGHAKADACDLTRRWRDKYGMWIANGILFNHESPRRGPEFVTRKITTALGRMACGLQETCSLGNLDSSRDWGSAQDYVQAMWLMLQQPEPDDYVIATGKTWTVREMLDAACQEMQAWCGKNDTLIGAQEFRERFTTDPSLFRPAEVNCLLGDASKARAKLGWEPRTTFQELIRSMVENDYRLAFQEAVNMEVSGR